jgi:molybdopterin-biosynthesis enzyme MoeA-like protein
MRLLSTNSDSNSNFFAKQCFDLGIELKKIEVIADDEEEIVEAARRMTEKYDFVVCSGGIGPTHVSPATTSKRSACYVI